MASEECSTTLNSSSTIRAFCKFIKLQGMRTLVQKVFHHLQKQCQKMIDSVITTNIKSSSSRKHPTLASAAYRKPLILHSVALDSTENPLRIASIAGHIDFVKEILRRLCQLEGREKKNPVPYAATKGKADVISEMLLACPECVEDMTVQKKTA
ncbi:hypothetical protein CFP56_016633 [Quercus suber]|uniref:Uncharacterized protein n=1 Tax=Quercus suber TaxID=58331 RepID=A0AAW0KQ53_QUESU